MSCGISYAQNIFSPHGNAVPLMPFLDYYIDETGSWDIDEAASADHSANFKPLNIKNLPGTEGIFWIRFILNAAEGTKPQSYLLDMGASIPGTPLLYEPETNQLSGSIEWRESAPAEKNILLLPEARPEPIICYIKLDGLPGPFFAPYVRSPQNVAGNAANMSRTGAILALGLIFILCLMRGLGEKGQWRFWTAFFVASCLLQTVLGLPKITEHTDFINLAAILLPGISLMVLPHVGRHLMCAREHSKSIDIQLLLLSLPGAALALLPLIPGWDWLFRWLNLWPAVMVIFMPTAIGAWVMGLDGSLRFLLACALPPACVAFAFLGMDFGLPANILSSLPVWGLGFSSVLLVALRAPGAAMPSIKKTSATKIVTPKSDENIINLGHPLDDPNLRVIGFEEAAAVSEPYPVKNEPEQNKQTEKELALREPLDDIIRETTALSHCSLPAAAQEYAEKIIAASEKMASILSDSSTASTQDKQTNETFTLQQLLRNAHDAVAPLAEQAGISFSWSIPPHLDQQFVLNAAELENILALLLESSIRATSRGAVHIQAKRMPESTEDGHILFLITDSGSGKPPLMRSAMALIKAWEFAGKYNGFLSMDSNSQGVTVSFSAHLPLANTETPVEIRPHVILVAEDPEKQQKLKEIIEVLPARVSLAGCANEVLVCQRMNAASLLIACDRFAMPSQSDMTHEFHDLALAAGFSSCAVLAVTKDKSQWTLLKPSGFTHALLEPVDPEILQDTIRELAKNSPLKTDGSKIDICLDNFINIDDCKKKEENTRYSEILQEKPLCEKNKDDIPFEGPQWLKEQPENNESEVNEDTNAIDTVAAASINNINIENVNNNEKKEQNISIKNVDEQNNNNNNKTDDTSDILKAAKNHLADTNEELPAGNQKISEICITEKLENFAPNKLIDAENSFEANNRKLGEQAENSNKNSLPDENEQNNELMYNKTSSGVKEQNTQMANQNSITDFIMNIGTLDKTDKSDNKVKDAPPPAAKQASESRQINQGARQDPIIQALVDGLDEALIQAQRAYAQKDTDDVAKATNRLAQQAESFGLRLLTRMAQCVERAALAKNFEALKDLLPELSHAVERNRIALTQKNSFSSSAETEK